MALAVDWTTRPSGAKKSANAETVCVMVVVRECACRGNGRGKGMGGREKTGSGRFTESRSVRIEMIHVVDPRAGRRMSGR